MDKFYKIFNEEGVEKHIEYLEAIRKLYSSTDYGDKNIIIDTIDKLLENNLGND